MNKFITHFIVDVITIHDGIKESKRTPADLYCNR